MLSAHDKGSHAEVEVKVQKVLSHTTKVKIQRGRATLYPESWTARGCTCPILNPGQTPREAARILSFMFGDLSCLFSDKYQNKMFHSFTQERVKE